MILTIQHRNSLIVSCPDVWTSGGLDMLLNRRRGDVVVRHGAEGHVHTAGELTDALAELFAGVDAMRAAITGRGYELRGGALASRVDGVGPI